MSVLVGDSRQTRRCGSDMRMTGISNSHRSQGVGVVYSRGACTVSFLPRVWSGWWEAGCLASTYMVAEVAWMAGGMVDKMIVPTGECVSGYILFFSSVLSKCFKVVVSLVGIGRSRLGCYSLLARKGGTRFFCN